MSEISKEALEAALKLADLLEEPPSSFVETIQGAIDKATEEKDWKTHTELIGELRTKTVLLTCRVAEMEKILDGVYHLYVSYKLSDDGMPAQFTCHPACPRCAWEKLKGVKP